MSSMPPHPQDIANLILYLQTELALFEQQAQRESVSPEALAHITRCQKVLRKSVDQMGLQDWYQELTFALRDQLGRLEEWL